MKTLQECLNARASLLLEIFLDIQNNPDKLEMAIMTAARSEVSRHYSEIAGDDNVVWGEGGGQTARIKELKESGEKFLRIPSSKYSKEKDMALYKAALEVSNEE